MNVLEHTITKNNDIIMLVRVGHRAKILFGISMFILVEGGIMQTSLH